jgi:hypothetical protein
MLAVNRKHHQPNFALTIIGDGFVNRRPFVEFEILVGGFVIGPTKFVVRLTARHLGMSVDVNGDEVFNIHLTRNKEKKLQINKQKVSLVS